MAAVSFPWQNKLLDKKFSNAVLEVYRNKNRIDTHKLGGRVVTVFGREAKKADILCLHESISRVHLAIVQSKEKLFVVDVGSTQGSWWNRKRLKANLKQELRDGDVLKLAKSSRRYVVNLHPQEAVAEPVNRKQKRARQPNYVLQRKKFKPGYDLPQTFLIVADWEATSDSREMDCQETIFFTCRILETRGLSLVAQMEEVLKPTLNERLSLHCLNNIVYDLVDQKSVNEGKVIGQVLDRFSQVCSEIKCTDQNCLVVSFSNVHLRDVLFQECRMKSVQVPIQLQKWTTIYSLLDNLYTERKSLNATCKKLRLPFSPTSRIDNMVEFVKYYVRERKSLGLEALRETGWDPDYRPQGGHIYKMKVDSSVTDLFC